MCGWAVARWLEHPPEPVLAAALLLACPPPRCWARAARTYPHHVGRWPVAVSGDSTHERRRSGSLLACPPHISTSSGRLVSLRGRCSPRTSLGAPRQAQSAAHTQILQNPSHRERWRALAQEMGLDWEGRLTSLDTLHPTPTLHKGQVWQARPSDSCGR